MLVLTITATRFFFTFTHTQWGQVKYYPRHVPNFTLEDLDLWLLLDIRARHLSIHYFYLQSSMERNSGLAFTLTNWYWFTLTRTQWQVELATTRDTSPASASSVTVGFCIHAPLYQLINSPSFIQMAKDARGSGVIVMQSNTLHLKKWKMFIRQ
jgi:hypothetical protein